MDKYLLYAKAAMTGIVSFVVSGLGGYDDILSLLIALIIADLVTGIVYAIMTKKLSSKELRNGIMRKVLVFLAIYIAYKVDICIASIGDSPLEVFGFAISIRTLFVVYSCLGEGISLLENLANIGVPFPKWLKDILIQVNDCVNTSTPRAILSWIKKTFDIDIKADEVEKDTDIDKGM